MQKKIFQILGVIAVFTGCVSSPNIVPPGVDSREENFKEITVNAQTLNNGKQEKGELDKKDYIIEIDGYKTPVDSYSVFLTEKQDMKITVKSLADTFGFSKSIMFPVIEIYNGSGEKIEGKYEKYEKDVSALNSVSILAEKKYAKLDEGQYYIIVFSDMKTNDRIVLDTIDVLFFPVKEICADKSEYGKYRIAFE